MNTDHIRYTYISCTHENPQSLSGATSKPAELSYVSQIGQLADEHLFSVPLGTDTATARSWLSSQGAQNVKEQVPKQRVKRGGEF